MKIVASIFFLSGMAAIGMASTITYTEQITASGTIGSAAFEDALLTLMFTGDTSNVTGGSGFFTIDATGTTISISGIGSGTVTDSGIEVFVNQGAVAAGFGSAQGSILDTFDNAFGTYDLTTAIGPITDTNFIRPDLTFATTLGGLNIASGGDSTFTASTGVPEPMSAGLVALGLAIVAGAPYKRNRAAA